MKVSSYGFLNSMQFIKEMVEKSFGYAKHDEVYLKEIVNEGGTKSVVVYAKGLPSIAIPLLEEKPDEL